MLRGMTMRHLLEWRAYYDIEPFGEVRADYRSAQVTAAILNSTRKRGTAPVKLEDSVLKFGAAAAVSPPSPEEARKQIIRTMGLLVAIHNAPTEKESRPRAKRLRS